ncbi:MarR family winged helix-turn-helix transcriptional regulator [Amycolatopsis sp. NBRC 101858]|uniref:MarR family winged helix-turn-helix transcriptional regulator n=1 Tax=Amycolatopsis sp. NBRC 101858 TaxID=3032200 RepID=UPI002555900D|nr:MarR family transcriptional regulator [Amycolatopsis sp. NBRC 101858]
MTEERPVRWLNEAEMAAWRSYIVATLKLRQVLHRELAVQHDVSLTDYEVLVCLEMQAGHRMRMSELALLMGSTKSRLSHQVGRLEDAGLVLRVRDPEDKRGVITELTDEGLALLAKAAPTHLEGVREHLIDLLSPAEQATIAAAFDRVLGHLSEVDG